MNTIYILLLATTTVASAAMLSTDTKEIGEWSAWGPWSSCSSACVCTRVRKCNAKAGPSLDLSTLLLLGGLGGSGSTSTASSLLPLLLSGGSLDATSILLFSTLGGGSSATSSLLPLILSGGLGGSGLGGSDSLTTLLLLTSLAGNSTSSSSNDLLPLLLAGQGGLGGSTGNSGGMLSQDPIMTLLLLNTLNENGTSGIMDLLPILLSGSASDQNSDMTLMLLLLGMGGSGNSTSSGLDPFLLFQLLGQGSSTGSSSGVQCVGSSAETTACDQYPCTINNCLSNWGYWDKCSATCGYSTQRRTRGCTCTDPSMRQSQCTPQDLEETRQCAYTSCETPSGQWGEWSGYSECKPYGAKCYKTKRRMCSVDIGCVGAFEQAIECPCKIANQCAVPSAKRSDCGVPGITQKTCEESGCCFDSSQTGSVWCYYPQSA